MAICALVMLKWVDPPTSSVQMERRVESWFRGGAYHKQYSFVPLSQISLPLQHAVISAEDARFYLHHGFDWKQCSWLLPRTWRASACEALPQSTSSL